MALSLDRTKICIKNLGRSEVLVYPKAQNLTFQRRNAN